MAGRKPSSEKQDRHKQMIPFPRDLLEHIDDYGFAHRIRHRGDVVLRLVRRGLEAEAEGKVAA